MPVKATELTKGTVLLYEGQLHLVLDTDHVKPGKGPAYVQAKMKNIETGTIRTNRINSSDRLDDVEIETRPMQFLYDQSGYGEGPFIFMDQNTFDQIEISAQVLTKDQSQWLAPDLEVKVTMFEGRILDVQLPASVELTITETTPQVKGGTATNQLKDAIVETGGRVRVPPFIEQGQKIRVSPQTGEYLGKA